ncbi:hypothetical protein QO010_002178 [Caulobacter ginsengisoli]|uniref:Uncharacterized protein n=1 Tax=Caulobacter ginsengisoli TaxID=400775 RepID=A0ABU0IQU8_9CAUL|nr:hypothetical protein [Caulobacter ginsengisoli]MDQ0464397.1 hypothetical protein [Caulobacter ginsengisoli]
MADDGYDVWYAERLWNLLPAVYRDLDTGGALREIIGRIGVQAATVRRSIDRLSDNAFIETCDDWAIPYLGELLATRTVSCLDTRAQRLDVANTIHYRRRAGTVALLEALAHDISGHDAKIGEFFRRLGRTRHQFDPPVGLVPRVNGEPAPLDPAVIEGLAGQHTGTPAGGLADLRNAYGAANAHSAFDEFAHTADFRRGRQSTGWHNIPKLGVFVWRLYAYPIHDATPVERTGCAGQFSFDPTGRDIPLFIPSRPPSGPRSDDWVAAEEWQLPVAVRVGLWKARPDQLYPRAFFVGLVAGNVSAPVDRTTLWIDPTIGRFRFLGATPLGQIASDYHFGFSGPVGAGGFDPRLLPELALPTPKVAVSGGTGLPTSVANDKTFEIADSVTYPNPGNISVSANAAITARAETRPLLRWKPHKIWRINGQPGSRLTLQGMHLQNADLRLTGEFDSVRLRLVTLDPGSSGAGDTPPTLYQKTVDGIDLAPGRLLIEARIGELIIERCIMGPIRTVLTGSADTIRISDSIVQSIPSHPAGANPPALIDIASLAAGLKTSNNPQAKALVAGLTAAVQKALAKYVYPHNPTGALATALRALALGPNGPLLAKLFPLALGDLALGFSSGTVQLIRTTVMGPTYTHRLAASECVLDDIAQVEDAQHGCVRFSVYAQGSQLHAPYRCLVVPPHVALFDSRVFGRPPYGRLTRDADVFLVAPGPHDSIQACAEDGAEPGAFHSERANLKRRGLAQKYLEYMPIGQTPVWIDAD